MDAGYMVLAAGRSLRDMSVVVGECLMTALAGMRVERH